MHNNRSIEAKNEEKNFNRRRKQKKICAKMPNKSSLSRTPKIHQPKIEMRTERPKTTFDGDNDTKREYKVKMKMKKKRTHRRPKKAKNLREEYFVD